MLFIRAISFCTIVNILLKYDLKEIEKVKWTMER